MSHHVVRRGETLSAIAHRFHTTARILARMNGIRDPSRLPIGFRLVVPGPRDPQPAAAASSAQQPQPSRTGAPARSNTPVPQSPAPAQAGDITAEQLSAIMPNAGNRVDTFLAPLNAAMRAHGITTVEQQAAFLAQISVESGDLRNTEESLNYSVAGLAATFGDSRISEADRNRLGRQPGERRVPADRQEEIGNIVYGGAFGRRNLGNTQPGDGYRYRGRGLMQTTGRANYRAAGFENNPEALAEPENAANSAATFWDDNGLNARTQAELDRRQFDGVSRTVNGGGHGIDERWQAYQRALTALRPVAVP